MPSGERTGPGRGQARGRRQGGFTYLGVLLLVTLIGLALATAGEVAATAARREREAQLLWAGHQYRAAIGRFWARKHAYPQALEELLGSGPDDPVQVRFLRRLYPDPMTNAVDWALIAAPGGGIMGVASTSSRPPLKTAHFDDLDKAFEDASTYGDWKFMFLPSMARRLRP